VAVLQVDTCDVGVDIPLALAILILVDMVDFDVLELMGKGYEGMKWVMGTTLLGRRALVGRGRWR
jgi:hypothetical protein